MNLIELYNAYSECVEIYDTDTDQGMDMWNDVHDDLWMQVLPFHVIADLNHILNGFDLSQYNVLFRYTVMVKLDNNEIDYVICMFGDKDIKEAGGIFQVLANHMLMRKLNNCPWDITKRECWLKKGYYKELEQVRCY